MSREICGECKYNKYSTTEKEFYCSNTDSDNYGMSTMYDDSCEDFEEKEWVLWIEWKYQMHYHQ